MLPTNANRNYDDTPPKVKVVRHIVGNKGGVIHGRAIKHVSANVVNEQLAVLYKAPPTVLCQLLYIAHTGCPVGVFLNPQVTLELHSAAAFYPITY